ncbi:MoxR family ATPase [Alphaproteobacteria bacterium]|jgi:MoxR-like ATPase|nr:MoxR family ATPase [Alphaproteobacteria bacterium]MDC1111273.1 MoxR family ATPase [Alphaproteobacteria bacterium]MDG1982310.1 MoxR family ATPase [Alphaproteobacteria bacterium]|tara:strand:+ start:551 stop:1444 length:894 start_codon:yes stop_codon:yes gene_type:complete
MLEINNITKKDQISESLSEVGYISNVGLSTAIYLTLKLKKPILLEGEAGVGKTDLAKSLSLILDKPLIRLQCYEGLDMASAAYEWNFAAQMISIQKGNTENIYSKDFLQERPLLKSINNTDNFPILLIDEIDRADPPFEAFLLEILSDWQITIPEIGTIKAKEPPIVIITSNRTREIHDALKRRCLYHFVDYPDLEQELKILQSRVPNIREDLSVAIVHFVKELRKIELFKQPGIAETIDWAQAMVELNYITIDPEVLESTIGALLKNQDDIRKLKESEAAKILTIIQTEISVINRK